MNLLYISKHSYIEDDDGNVFSTGMMGPEYFEKYLKHFDSVTVIGYVHKATESNIKKIVGTPICNSDRITFHLAPCGSGRIAAFFTNKAIKTLVKKYIKEANAVACKSASGASFAAYYAKRFKKTYMIEVVGCPWDALKNHSFFGKLIAPIEFVSLRRTVKHAPFVTYVTNRFLQKRYPTDGKNIGISDVQLEEVDYHILEKRLNRLSEDTIKIGTAGAIHIAYKGQEYVIKALARLKAEGNKKFEYHLAGGGDSSRLKHLSEQLGVEEQVVFEGSIPHDKIFEWIDSLDVYIQPSLTEGLPRAVIEAMSRGAPCFVSNAGGMPELVDKEAIFKRKDYDEIARMLGSLSKIQMSQMAIRNFEKAKEFEKQRLAEKRRAFYADFAAAAKEL